MISGLLGRRAKTPAVVARKLDPTPVPRRSPHRHAVTRGGFASVRQPG